MATSVCIKQRGQLAESFQSIGVTKDWRRAILHNDCYTQWSPFPINRRHQGLATGFLRMLARMGTPRFPINRRHQGLATNTPDVSKLPLQERFPINRRHQGLATRRQARVFKAMGFDGFQSIGVTKDWRPRQRQQLVARVLRCFQSIGVTKDWRP